MARICVVCAKKCHFDHEIMYDEYTSSYCNCGELSSECIAMCERDSLPNVSSIDETMDFGKISFCLIRYLNIDSRNLN